MSTSNLDQLKTWLNSAYSMEESLVQVLTNHAKDAEDFPEIAAREQQHLEETRQHAEKVKRCLKSLGEEPSKVKSLWGQAMGMVQGMSTGPFEDELVKNCLADYASEHFEIACYSSLIAAAEALEQPEIATLCREILREEVAMAQWLEDKIPEVTRTFLETQEVKA